MSYENITVEYNNGCKYVGQIKNNKREGKGIMYSPTGDKYEGDFKNDLPNGKGIFSYSNGNKYDGDFLNGNPNGYGIFYIKKGNKYNIYKGEVKNGIPEGKGNIEYSDGIRYEGNFDNGEPNGIGKIYYFNGNIYEGEIYKCLVKGKGVMYLYNGEKYEGYFDNTKPNGKGVYYYKNGNRYEGDFINGCPEGKGKKYYKNGNIYEGDFKNGQPNGIGVITFTDCEMQYKGEIKGEGEEGRGILILPDGKNIEIGLTITKSGDIIINSKNDNDKNSNESDNNINNNVNLSRTKAKNIIDKLFGVKITIEAEIYEKTLYLPTCIIKIKYIESMSFSNSSSLIENEITITNGKFDNFNPKTIIKNNEIGLELINNINKIFTIISIEIGNGTIKYSVKGDTLIIEVDYDNHNLIIEITPLKISFPREIEKLKEEIITPNNNYKDLINFGFLIGTTCSVFKIPSLFSLLKNILI